MKGALEFRAATEADLPRVAQIHVEAWRTAYRGIIDDARIDALDVSERLGYWRRWRTGEGVRLELALADAEIVGFARLCPARPIDDAPPHFAEVTHLYVDPERRGEHVGALLLRNAIDRAHADGFEGLLLWVLEKNHRARAFYAREGFAPDGARHDEPDWLGPDVFEVRYRIDLPRVENASAKLDPTELEAVDPDSLLATLREHSGRPSLRYVTPPSLLGVGSEAVIEGFVLAPNDTGWTEALVLRRLLPTKAASQVRFEEAVHTALGDQGYPVPRVFLAEPSSLPLGAPFVVMERLWGTPPLGEVARPAELASKLHVIPGVIREAIATVPRLLGSSQARLHALDPAPLRRAVEAAGLDTSALTFDGRVERLAELIRDVRLDGLAPGLQWLAEHRPEAEPPVICHGDFVFTNLTLANGELEAVFDWSFVTLAEPAYDVAATLARLESRVPGMPLALSLVTRAVQRIMRRAYLRSYRAARPLDDTRLRYFAAYWLLYELARSGERLRAGLRSTGRIEHRWLDAGVLRHGVAGFEALTGLELAPEMPS